MKCGNHGCQWEGTVGCIDSHSATCNFAMVVCPNKCKADGVLVELIRQSISEHLQVCPNREFQCPYCQEKGTYVNITGVHDNKCNKKVISCPHSECALQLERGKMEDHVQTECEYGLVPCKYKNIGCKEVRTRKEMSHHEKDSVSSHLELAVAELEAVKQKSVTLGCGESIGFKISGFSALKKENGCFYSDSFYAVGGGWKVRLAIYPNGRGTGKGTHVSVQIEFLKRDTNCWQDGGIKITLLNQVSDCYHHTVCVPLKNLIKFQCTDLPLFISQAALVCRDSSRYIQFLQEDNLYFRFSMHSYHHKSWLDCGVKLDNCLRLKMKQNVFKFKVCGYSTAHKFISLPSIICQGCRMTCIVAESVQSSNIAFYCSIIRSTQEIPSLWPITGTFTAELRNQVEDRNHYVRTLPCRVPLSGDMKVITYGGTFISKLSLQENSPKVQYLKDDILYFRVMYQLNREGRTPWLDTESECMKLLIH